MCAIVTPAVSQKVYAENRNGDGLPKTKSESKLPRKRCHVVDWNPVKKVSNDPHCNIENVRKKPWC